MKKKSARLSLEERKKRNNAIWFFLEALPPAKHSPFYQDHALEKTLKRLKAFFRFLTALNPKQYLAWILNAFSYSTSTTLSMLYEAEKEAFSSSGETESVPPLKESAPPRKNKQTRKHVITPG